MTDDRTGDRVEAAAFVTAVSVTGASISTLGGLLGSETVSATDDRVARIDELQFDLGEGPCWDALSTGRPVLEPDLRARPRRHWAAFSPALSSEDVAALFAVPLIVGPLRIGAVDLYDVRARPLEGDDLAKTLALAAVVGRQVLRRAIAHAQPGQERPGPFSRRVIHQATGFVIVQLGVSASDAELLMQARAFAAGLTMQQVAEDIVNRRTRFTMEGSAIEDGR
ncbi:MAG: hypothetical protein QOC59_127 [Microbacteriaceae bacterium]|jgi:GAF domain-containing protein|nr:hypothetical protein [Microbacteriaceae bacterium]